MSDRIIVRVQWDKSWKQWKVRWSCDVSRTSNANLSDFPKCYNLQEAAIRAARRLGRNSKPAQLVVHGKKGKILFECTYGRDPRKSKG